MIEEEYISFETAKLAKEKGLDIPTRYGFSERRSLVRVDTSDNWNQDKELYSRPTQSLLARWLREKHKMIVSCVFNYETKMWTYFIGNYNNPISKSSKEYNFYEDAMEAGLQEALNLFESAVKPTNL